MVKRSAGDRKILAVLGESVRRYRTERGMSQEDLALACGLDRTYIGGIERGERNVGLLNLVLVAQALRVHPGDLLAELH